MTIAAEPIAKELGTEVSGLGGSGSSKGSKAAGGAAFGAGLFSKALPKPKTSHPYIVGAILIVIGFAGMVGSITGQLPAMVAALFDPSILTDKGNNSPGGVQGAEAGFIAGLANPTIPGGPIAGAVVGGGLGSALKGLIP